MTATNNKSKKTSKGSRTNKECSNGKKKDLYHNQDYPCCDLVSNIAKDIFPFMPFAQPSSTNTTKQQHEQEQNIDPKNVSKKINTSSNSEELQHKPSLFSTLIRNYVLEEQRIKNAAVEEENKALTSHTTISVKKKKKKKKKQQRQQQEEEKRIEGIVSDTTTAMTVTADTGITSITDSNIPITRNTSHEKHEEQLQQQQPSNETNIRSHEGILDESILLDIFQSFRSISSSEEICQTIIPNRELSSFIDYINHHYQEQQYQALDSTTKQERQHPASSKKKKNRMRNINSNKPSPNNSIPILSTANLLDNHCSTNDIECTTCQENTLAFVQRYLCKKHNSSKMCFNADIISTVSVDEKASLLSIPTVDHTSLNGNGYDEDDLEHAFDYIAMEEGETPPKEDPKTMKSITFVTTDTTPHANINSPNTKPSTSKEETEFYFKYITLSDDFFPCDVEKMMHFMKLLLSSVYSIAPIKTQEEQPKTTNAIADDSRTNIPNLITSLKTRQREIDEEIQQLSLSTNTQQFFLSSSFDVKTSTHLQHTDQLCKVWFDDITTFLFHLSTSSLSSSSDNTSNGNSEVIQSLWNIYETTCHSLLQYIIHFQKGQILHSAPTSNTYSEVEHIIPQLYLSSSLRQSYIKYIQNKYNCICELYDAIFTMDQSSLFKRAEQNTTLNDGNKVILLSLLNQRVSLVYTTILRGNITDIVHEQTLNMEKIYDFIKLNDITIEQHVSITPPVEEKSTIKPIDLIQALSLKLQTCCKDINYVIKQQPFLKNNKKNAIQYDTCSNGKRRCIILTSCLLYKWFELRCQEWNVDLTEQELLHGYTISHTSQKKSTSNSMEMNSEGTTNKKRRNAKVKKQPTVSSQEDKEETKNNTIIPQLLQPQEQDHGIVQKEDDTTAITTTSTTSNRPQLQKEEEVTPQNSNMSIKVKQEDVERCNNININDTLKMEVTTEPIVAQEEDIIITTNLKQAVTTKTTASTSMTNDNNNTLLDNNSMEMDINLSQDVEGSRMNDPSNIVTQEVTSIATHDESEMDITNIRQGTVTTTTITAASTLVANNNKTTNHIDSAKEQEVTTTCPTNNNNDTRFKNNNHPISFDSTIAQEYLQTRLEDVLLLYRIQHNNNDDLDVLPSGIEVNIVCL